MTSVDEIVRELAHIHDALATLGDDDRAERERLLARQEALRTEARELAAGLDDPRSTHEIDLELAQRKRDLAAISDQKIDLVKQASAGGGNLSDAVPEATLNRRLMEANGAREIEARIAHLERLLQQRRE